MRGSDPRSGAQSAPLPLPLSPAGLRGTRGPRGLGRGAEQRGKAPVEGEGKGAKVEKGICSLLFCKNESRRCLPSPRSNELLTF